MMDGPMRLLFALGLAFAAGCSAARPPKAPPLRFAEAFRADDFLRGSLHAHSLESDGDAPPAEVLGWYRTHGYGFAALTDHDKRVDTSSCTVPGRFAAIAGDELTSRALWGGRAVPVHVNALCGRGSPAGLTAAAPPGEVLKRTVERARGDGAVVLVNHPNFGRALGEPDLLDAGAFDMLEIASGHPEVHDRGEAGRPSAEALWDGYLTRRGPLLAAAVDDAHDFRSKGEDRRPGRAWVEAWGAEPEPASVCAALRAGRFYASRGARLRSLRVEGGSFEVDAADWRSGDLVEFIGAGGELLERASSNPARYVLRGGELYVRARVRQAGGREAWTQAYFVR